MRDNGLPKAKRRLIWAVAGLALTGCADLTPGKVVAVAPPASAVAACSAPVTLPERDLSAAEVEIYWGRDRSALRICASRHEVLAQHLED